MRFIVSDEIKRICPSFIGCSIETEIINSSYSDMLWTEIEQRCAELSKHYNTESLKSISAIEATRNIYKLCGKDPSRYRPSAEALIRRVIKGNKLYQINTVVDLINLASIIYGYSIGGFDADKIHGDTLTLGIGRNNEPYTGIGRGEINIEGLPVYRDELGGIGTPTSDHERTKITNETKRLLVLINGYDGNEKNVRLCGESICSLLNTYAHSKSITLTIY